MLYITKDKEKYLDNHLQSDICYQKDFLKEPSPTKLIFYLKFGQNYSKDVKVEALNFLDFDVGFSYFEA